MLIDPIALTLSNIQQDMQKVNVIANNAANALTPGFKREFLAVAQREGMTEGNQEVSSSDKGSLLKIYTDQRLGVSKQTGAALDVALTGEGYFEVSLNEDVGYTRRGNFRLNESGKLVTQDGSAVMGMAGEIYLMTPNPVIAKDGAIYEQGKQVAQLKVVVPERTANQMIHAGNGLLRPPENVSMRIASLPRMSQGQLESSNVDSTQEMVRMVEVFRHFESSHRLLQAYDDLNDKTLRNLGQF